jgi:transcriptional regulator with XRE-family HTH domain
MSYGYSARLIALNKKASAKLAGVRLGRMCIKQDIPVAAVAAKLGVSRQTVYNWFCGTHAAHPDTVLKLQAYLTSLSS